MNRKAIGRGAKRTSGKLSSAPSDTAILLYLFTHCSRQMAVGVKTVLGSHFGWWVNSPPTLVGILVVGLG